MCLEQNSFRWIRNLVTIFSSLFPSLLSSSPSHRWTDNATGIRRPHVTRTANRACLLFSPFYSLSSLGDDNSYLYSIMPLTVALGSPSTHNCMPRLLIPPCLPIQRRNHPRRCPTDSVPYWPYFLAHPPKRTNPNWTIPRLSSPTHLPFFPDLPSHTISVHVPFSLPVVPCFPRIAIYPTCFHRLFPPSPNPIIFNPS